MDLVLLVCRALSALLNELGPLCEELLHHGRAVRQVQQERANQTSYAHLGRNLIDFYQLVHGRPKLVFDGLMRL